MLQGRGLEPERPWGSGGDLVEARMIVIGTRRRLAPGAEPLPGRDSMIPAPES